MDDVFYTFSTRDINKAAFVWSQPRVELKDSSGRGEAKTSIYFNFTVPMSEADFHNLMMQYENGKTLVEPNTFCSKLAKLRDIIFNSTGKNSKR